MTTNRLQELHDAGVSIWLDFIARDMLRNGDLQRRIAEDALTGMTSNPTIFEKALSEGTEYDEQIDQVPRDKTIAELFELLATDDVRSACDIFRDVVSRTRGADGFVSIEVSPGVANDADATVDEARRLWRIVNRPNVMIKVPGTETGAKAVRQLIALGINVNITLLFSVEAYRRVIDAYLEGLGERVWSNKPIDHVHSVASFFVSRVDGEVDKRLEAQIAGAKSQPDKDRLKSLEGKTAIANAKIAYKLFQEMFSGERWSNLEAKGANIQRVLWASTSTKNPAYRDVMYVEELIGPHIVNTMPPATIDSFRDHGIVKRTVDANVDAATAHIAALAREGIAIDDVTAKLLADGISSFQKSYDTLIGGLEKKTAQLAAAR